MLEQQINEVLSQFNASADLKTALLSVLFNNTNTQLETLDKTIYDSPVNLQSAATWSPSVGMFWK